MVKRDGWNIGLLKGEQVLKSLFDQCVYWENKSLFYKMRFVP